MKITLLVGPMSPYVENLVEQLKKLGYQCIKSTNPDEIDQVGRQGGRVLLLFSDPKFAYQFLLQNSWKDIITCNILYTEKNMSIRKEVQRKLDHVNLNVYHSGEMAKLLKKYEAFYNGEDDAPEELEFLIPEPPGDRS